MAWCGVVWYIVWDDMVVWYGILYGMAWCGVVWYIVWDDMVVWYGRAWYGMWCGMVWYMVCGVVQYGIWYVVWYGMVYGMARTNGNVGTRSSTKRRTVSTSLEV